MQSTTIEREDNIYGLESHEFPFFGGKSRGKKSESLRTELSTYSNRNVHWA